MQSKGEQGWRQRKVSLEGDLSEPGVSGSFVVAVWTPAKLPLVCVWFARIQKSRSVRGQIGVNVGWQTMSRQFSLDVCGRFEGPCWRCPYLYFFQKKVDDDVTILAWHSFCRYFELGQLQCHASK